jgi:hypothetical protein
MIIAIIILGVLLAVAAAIIFCLGKVLKNTFLMTEGLLDIVEGKQPMQLKKAYNGVYYPATIIAKINFNSEWEGQVTDFSLYDKYKIVGLTIMTKESVEEYYGAELVKELGEIGDEALAALTDPVIIKNKIVYEVSEGVWAWKSA